jgi:hypothetical protein
LNESRKGGAAHDVGSKISIIGPDLSRLDIGGTKFKGAKEGRRRRCGVGSKIMGPDLSRLDIGGTKFLGVKEGRRRRCGDGQDVLNKFQSRNIESCTELRETYNVKHAEHGNYETPARLQFENLSNFRTSIFFVKLNSPGALILGRELNQI